MPDGIDLKRIIDLDPETTVTNDDYTIVDSSTGGAKKFALGQALNGLKEDLNNRYADTQISFNYGSLNTNTGIIILSPFTTTRLVAGLIKKGLFKYVVSKDTVIGFIVAYYDSTKTFVKATEWMLSTYYELEDYPYIAVLARNGNRGTDSFPSNEIPMYLSQVNSVPSGDVIEAIESDVNAIESDVNAIESDVNAIVVLLINDLTYIDGAERTPLNPTGLAQTRRWFIGKTIASNTYIQSIQGYVANKFTGTLYVELWKENGNTLEKLKTYDIDTADYNVGDTANIAIDYYSEYPLRIALVGQSNIFSLNFETVPETLLYTTTDTSLDTTEINISSISSFPGSWPLITIFCKTAKNVEPESDYTHVYTVGENDNVAAIIMEAMQHSGSVVYIEPYEHDCIAEWEEYFGSGYFANMSAGRGIELQNDIHIIGRSGHKLKCYYTGDNDYVMANFSLFNNPSGGSGYILENVCIDTKKIRYCIHDERGSDTVPYKVKYLRCIMSQDMTGSTWDHSRACIGGGMGQHGDIVVEDCIFNTVTSQANMDSLAYHNSSGNEAQNSLVIKNCYCAGDSTLQLASYGTSTAKTKVIVANCSFGSAIEELDWTSGTPNFEIYYINNEIRS